MDTKKKKTEAKINWGWDSPENRNGKATRTSKKNINKTKTTAKRLGFKGFLIALCLLVLSVAIGGCTCYFVSKDDCFDIIGNEQLTLMAGEKVIVENDQETTIISCENYTEEGCKVVEFGSDKSNKITIETDLVKNADGSYSPQKDINGNYILKTYYIIYTAKTLKYSKISNIKRIRLIDYVEFGENIIEDSQTGGNN